MAGNGHKTAICQSVLNQNSLYYADIKIRFSERKIDKVLAAYKNLLEESSDKVQERRIVSSILFIATR